MWRNTHGRRETQRYEELGVDAFGSRYEWKDSIKDLRAKYGSLTEEELAAKQIPVNVAGRLMSIRRMGKASFVNIKDEYGNMQAWLGRDVVGEHDYEDWSGTYFYVYVENKTDQCLLLYNV